MLVNHAHPLGDSHGGGGERHLFPVQPDFTASGLLQTEQHFHQRGFSRAILSHQGVNFPLADVQLNVLIGGNAVGIDLGDVKHPNDVFLVFVFLHILGFPLCVFLWAGL
ncbi:hypothetical protein SDC9_101431 [bioreactor metagenome]|uniref:Uncharacterized protein n=1 Tax=bioreactor metagenome TaxID=1076179 RepID=A0A645AN33_9ZZZZ